jgi:hypothetical protein
MSINADKGKLSMVNEIITVSIICLLTSTIAVFVALKIQARYFHKTELEHEAWQHAQEAHQNLWEVKHKKQIFDLEQSLSKEVRDINEAWQSWEYKAAQHYANVTLEQKLASLPYIEDIPVPSTLYITPEQSTHTDQLSHPVLFFRTDLREQDLSRRFLQYADFRESQLENANFYMADLAGASFKGANLAGANLAGANLSGADLRDAILTRANMLVADLNGAILNGANFSGARNLTVEQFNSAIYNRETQIDIEHDITHAHIAQIHYTSLPPEAETPSTEISSPVHSVPSDEKSHANSN